MGAKFRDLRFSVAVSFSMIFCGVFHYDDRPGSTESSFLVSLQNIIILIFKMFLLFQLCVFTFHYMAAYRAEE